MSKKIISSWFEVDREGLRELQESKPKHHIIRELVQNAWDENTTKCEVFATWSNGTASITVEDDSPEGFRDLRHAYTLYATTYKRSEPEKRGRFNLGEKQILSICEEAYISTTKGTITFTKEGRKESTSCRESGSFVQVIVKMSREEMDELINTIKDYLPPKDVKFTLNYKEIPYRMPVKVFSATLATEFEEDGLFHKTKRLTEIELHSSDNPHLYEMGIPVTPIDSKYSIDIQQKIPLSTDRDTVPPTYLKTLYAEVLNQTFETLKPDESSDIWVRQASASPKISNEAIKAVVNKRYGDKAVVINPRDRNSVDEAISRGYRAVHGRELSKDEWANIRKADAMQSSSDIFPTELSGATPVEPTSDMLKYTYLAKKIARRVFSIDINVNFAEWDGVAAQYGDRTLTLNTKVVPKEFFESLSVPLLDLTIHELAHEKGNHSEHNYHAACTKMGAELTMIALKEPKFFDLEISRLEKY